MMRRSIGNEPMNIGEKYNDIRDHHISLTILLLIGHIAIFIAFALPRQMSPFYRQTPIVVFAQQMFSDMDKFLNVHAIFYIRRKIMVMDAISKRLIDWALCVIGGLRGGLAVSAQLATMFFGVCAAQPATVAAIGKFVYPTMIEQKYPKPFATGLISTHGEWRFIPPALPLLCIGPLPEFCVETVDCRDWSGIVYGLATLIYAWAMPMSKNFPGEKFSFYRLLKRRKNPYGL